MLVENRIFLQLPLFWKHYFYLYLNFVTMTSPACPSTHPEADKENQENRGNIINYKKSISFPKKKMTTEALQENFPPKKKGRKELSDLYDPGYAASHSEDIAHSYPNNEVGR